MARHSKWHKVKQFKGAIDAKRSASFTKLAREITVAVREKGADPAMNFRLRVAIERARKASMPKDSIERAIARGGGAGGEGAIESLTYEAYGPGGTALIIECLTDNRNRSANDVKHILSEHGGSLASPGSVTFQFSKKGVVRVTSSLPSEKKDEIELGLIDAGAEDILPSEEGVEIRCEPSVLAKVAEAAQAAGLIVESAEFEWIPNMMVETDEERGLALEELIAELDEHDDVSRVYTNAA